MTIIVAGERSGVGKTTVTLALLASLSRHQPVQSFKVGPDYIDPMFHQAVTGRPCRTLDPVLTSEAYVQQCFEQHSATTELSLIEGVMGLFDGAGDSDWASTAHIARLLEVPIVLVIDCGHLSRSVAAIVHGYRSFDPRLVLAGVVLNHVASDRHLEVLKGALAPLDVPVLGVLRRNAGIKIPDRHLGLVPTGELEGMGNLMAQLADLGDQCFNWDVLMPMLKRQAPSPLSVMEKKREGVRIAIAKDLAFNFYYPDNLELLEQAGADLVFWSPLHDTELPPHTAGLYLGGGFPEMFAAGLAENQPVQQAVKSAIQAGLPTYAECGGLMYLCQSLQNLQGHTYPMVGVLPTAVTMGARLTLGYRQATALQDTALVTKGTQIWGHEFHHSQLSMQSDAPLYDVSSYRSTVQTSQEGWGYSNLHASYVHLHWGTHPEIPQRFVEQAQRHASAVLRPKKSMR
ncbi:MAG: cobyrinate a,c-diamide synthase [Thermosynechococcaceae cyanobacterium]